MLPHKYAVRTQTFRQLQEEDRQFNYLASYLTDIERETKTCLNSNFHTYFQCLNQCVWITTNSKTRCPEVTDRYFVLKLTF
jgi:hypothetical protein